MKSESVTMRAPKTFEEAISVVGFGKYNLFILLATGGALMCVIIETMCAMFIIPAAQCDLNLSLTDKGILYSISFFGVVVSSHLWGYRADTRGRKNVVLCSLFFGAIASFIGSCVTITWLFIVLRFFNGFLIGGSSAIIYAYAGEFHDIPNRPKVVSWIGTFVGIGSVYLAGIAWIVLPQQWHFYIPLLGIDFRPWRLLMILYTIPSLFFGILIYFLAESPKYLLTQHRYDEALMVMKKIFHYNSGKSEDDFPVSAILWDETSGDVNHVKNEGMLRSMWEQTVPLFRKTYVVKTLMVSYVQFALLLSTSAVMMWYPQIINFMSIYSKIVQEGEVTMCKSILYDENNPGLPFANDTSTKARAITSDICDDTIDTDAFLVSLIIGVCYAICYIFIGTCINMFGARRLLIALIVITTIAGVCAQSLSGYSYVQITLGIFLLVATGVSIVNAIVVDLYPTQIRGMAFAISLLFGRLGAMVGSNIAGPMLVSNCDYMFYFFAVSHIVAVLFVIFLPSNKFAAFTNKAPIC